MEKPQRETTLNASDSAHGQRNETVRHGSIRHLEISLHGQRDEILVNGGIGGLKQELPDSHGGRKQAMHSAENGTGQTSETVAQPTLSTRDHLAAVLKGIDQGFSQRKTEQQPSD